MVKPNSTPRQIIFFALLLIGFFAFIILALYWPQFFATANNQSNPETTEQMITVDPETDLNALFQTLEPGDTVIMQEGIYKQSNLYTKNSGLSHAPITIQAQPGAQVVWQVEQSNTLWHIITGRYWIIKDIIFEGRLVLGNNETGDIAEHIVINNCQFRNSTGGIRATYARHLLIEDCTFVNLRSGQPGVDHNAIAVPMWGDDITIRNNYFEDIGSDAIHLGTHGNQIGQVIIENNKFLISGQRSPVGENAVDVKGVQGPVVIRNNIIHGFRATAPNQDASGAQGEGIVIHWTDTGGPSAKNVLVEKNLFFDNALHLVIAHGAQNITVRNNIFRDAFQEADPGIGLWVHGATEVGVLHNTFFNNSIHLRSGGSKVTTGVLKNNLFWRGNVVGVPQPGKLSEWDADYNVWTQVETVPEILQGLHDIIDVDPNLEPDLKPKEGSPLINAGVNAGAFDDFAQNPRPTQNPAIGAFEYVNNLNQP